MREHLDDCPALRKIYVSRASEEIADPRVARLESVVGATNDWAIAAGDIAPPAIAAEPDDDVAIFYTSGTTGKPKGAVISHRNIISNMFNSAVGASARVLAPRRSAARARSERAAEIVPDLGAVLPRHRLLRGDDPVPDGGQQDRHAAPLGCRSGAAADRNASASPISAACRPSPGRCSSIRRVDEYDLSSIEGVSYGGAPAAPELVKPHQSALPERASPAKAGA